MFKLFKKKRLVSSLSDKLNEYFITTSKTPNKTYVFVKFAHKDKKISYHICELKGDIVEINGSAYYVSTDSLFTFDFYLGKEKVKVTTVDIYEGITAGYTPFEDRLTDIYNEKVQKAIYLYLMSGIMETKLKQKTKMKTIIITVMLGIAGIFILFKMFGS